MKTCEWQRGEDNEIQFIGELDRMTVPALWKQRKSWLSGEQVLTLNLQGVTKIDSAGVAMLLEAKRAVLADQRELAITHANQQLHAMVQVSGVSALLQLNEHTNK
ncbi:STAS domain-containing protein [Pseudidiomarina tainanensis]|jgi:anti-anti-sigma factor|uniref:Phospholipid transport system transporter-binding protein n=2 Tax=Pseudidiomarina TaxID=2800384 RepID=A0A1I6GXE5_9GAMM|nr:MULTISPECIES: STAS domain-containing protein [Pseudidiomarina]RZQ56128.1 STAS domain-containing protein [Pseudidiomarina tainanensis]SFR46741.1 phospholipid transport system transporter-binding protein [Pseudidiomarina maritima]